ncbi:hypothetical protein H4R33_000987 [Dimargaris cristalligena]|nr:hypothetical protein H4R33_000987 [Dimargaris cristalligena]
MSPTQPQCAIVTGGASGIGRCLVTELVRLNFRVVVGDLNEAAGTELVAALNASVSDSPSSSSSSTPRAVFVHTDVTQPTAFATLFQAGTDHFGAVHILVNNAGIAQADPFWATEQWRSMVDVNLTATMAGTSAAIHYFTTVAPTLPATQAAGYNTNKVVINMASMSGLVPFPGDPIYAATKAAVVNFTRSLPDFTPLFGGVRFNCLCPAFVDTPMIDRLRAQSPLHEATLGRVAKVTAEEVVQGVLRCITERELNGAALVIACQREPQELKTDPVLVELLKDSLPVIDA